MVEVVDREVDCCEPTVLLCEVDRCEPTVWLRDVDCCEPTVWLGEVDCCEPTVWLRSGEQSGLEVAGTAVTSGTYMYIMIDSEQYKYNEKNAFFFKLRGRSLIMAGASYKLCD